MENIRSWSETCRTAPGMRTFVYPCPGEGGQQDGAALLSGFCAAAGVLSRVNTSLCYGTTISKKRE
jgi:hypothetical protein